MSEKLLLKRIGKMNPTSVDEFVKLGGFDGIKKAVKMKKEDVIEEVIKANLRGRGGAAYPAGKKWQQLYAIKENPKYIVCNADEGEPGTFKDRELLDKTPLSVIEGMLIAGYVFGSEKGYIYIRGEYLKIQKVFQEAIDNAVKAGFLGNDILGIKGFNFNITIVTGAGAYVCGENSTLLNSIEGKAGRPRNKPPHLAEVGLYSMPTLVNNVETFACIPVIMTEGGEKFLSYGTEFGGGTKLVSICGNVKNPGVYEVALGTPLKEILYGENFAGGTKSGMPIHFFHLGGLSAPIGFPEQIETNYCYQALMENGLSVGSGAIIVMDESVSLIDYLKHVVRFFVHESCGKCTPCRIGTTRLYELLEKFTNGEAEQGDIEKLEYLIDNISTLAACGLGQSVNKAIGACLKYRRNEFEALIGAKKGFAEICACGGGH